MLALSGGAHASSAVRTMSPGSSGLGAAEDSARLLSLGDYGGAARSVRRALLLSPDDDALQLLAGAVLLNTGDWAGARSAFRAVLAMAPEDSVALYGEGLAELGLGNRVAALREWRLAQAAGGDPVVLQLGVRYCQWLDGAQIGIDAAALPETFRSAASALEGMAAYRRRDWKSAASALESAQNALPGSPVVEPPDLSMTFDPAHPLLTSAPALGHSVDLKVAPPKDAGMNGTVEIGPGDLASSVAFVAYVLDGRTLGLVNTAPFPLTWDTRRVSNGWHQLHIVFYDEHGDEITRVGRRIRIFNRNRGILESANPSEATELRAALWQALALRPDRCACAYAQGVALRAIGDVAAARRWFAIAAAVRSDYLDTRRQWIACGGAGWGDEAIWGGSPDDRAVALTFDDGPRPGLTDLLLGMLEQEHVTATFFVVGKNVARYPELARNIVTAGMEIANHTYSHPNLTRLSPQAVASEVMAGQAIVQAATGKTPRFLRPPGGDWNGRVASAVRSWGLTPCMWTVDVYGSEVIGAQQVADSVLTQVRPGSIILMHNGKMSTMQALPTIIRELRKRHYTFVTVETLARRLSVAKAAARRALQGGPIEEHRTE